MYQADQIVALARLAGDNILGIYQHGYVEKTKIDQSPLTEGDLSSHHCIADGLKVLTLDIPVSSEESGVLELHGRQQWQKYWLIDPLDGTREFIKTQR
ncbi:MAG: 3',5' adenosine diphosphate 3' phosphatase [Osedax symbiont Rs2]|nr:MAG: 3',5' adenosine diphosphate 3' phosphatase [Osedax symbiont Rs2]